MRQKKIKGKMIKKQIHFFQKQKKHIKKMKADSDSDFQKKQMKKSR